MTNVDQTSDDSAARVVSGRERCLEWEEGASAPDIAQQADPLAPLHVCVACEPQPGDHVVEAADGRLFIDPEAARRIGDRRLDAFTNERGRVQFLVRAA